MKNANELFGDNGLGVRIISGATINNGNVIFSDDAISAIAEVAEYAKGTELYIQNKSREDELGDMSVYELYLHMIKKIGNAPSPIIAQCATILLVPLLHEKILKESE